MKLLHRLSVRMSPEDYLVMKEAAARDQRPLNQWVRVVCLAEAKRTAKLKET